MESTVKVLSLLEGTKFSANNDINVLTTAIDLAFTTNKNLWQKGTKEREQLNDLLKGELILNTEAYIAGTNLDNLVKFIQGLLLLTISLINGIGRSPISIFKKDEKEIQIKFFNKSESIKLTIGKYDKAMGTLLREFKKAYYGKAENESFARNELIIIKETFKETSSRLKNEKLLIARIAKDPILLFDDKINPHTFSATLFLVLAALPLDDLNAMLINIGSYLPADLEEKTEDNFSVKVRSYLTSSTQDIHELFKKIRLLLKLYFSKQKEIIAIIVKDKTRDFFKDLLKNDNARKQLKKHLNDTVEEQFTLRIKILEGLVKLL